MQIKELGFHQLESGGLFNISWPDFFTCRVVILGLRVIMRIQRLSVKAWLQKKRFSFRVPWHGPKAQAEPARGGPLPTSRWGTWGTKSTRGFVKTTQVFTAKLALAWVWAATSDLRMWSTQRPGLPPLASAYSVPSTIPPTSPPTLFWVRPEPPGRLG